MTGSVGRPLDRTDGVAKVTGRARYAAEFEVPGVTYAVMVQSTIPSGRIAKLDTAAAEHAPGVILVLTHENAQRLPEKGLAAVNPPAGRVLTLLQDDAIHYNGQPIAVVVADTFERAVDGAARVRVAYDVAPAVLRFETAKAQRYAPKKAGVVATDASWGAVDEGFARATKRVDATYTTPMEHHNPIEPHATIAAWKGDKLTLYDATQYISGVKQTVAKTLGIPPDNVRVVSKYVGGGFGCKGSVWSHVVLAAMAAQKANRPVKLVVARPQMFGPVGGRPRTEQHIVLGAADDGRLAALRHDVVSHTSQIEDFTEPSAAPTRVLYACPNASTTHRLVKLNVGTPTFQRAPGEATGTFALEVAMDELAYALGMDPLELRLRNYADREPESGKPWSQKSLRECYAQAAERFGWSRRNPAPRSMRDGNALVGWGVATATYPAHRQPASASARIMPDGTALVRSGTQDIGTGTYTIMTQVAADALGLPVERVRFDLGDTAFPQAPVSGGSMTAASVSAAVHAACANLRDRLVSMAVADRASPLHRLAPDDIAFDDGVFRAKSDPAKRESLAAIVARRNEPVEAMGDAKPGEDDKSFAMHSFGAVFTEVRVDPELGTIRVPRIVATYDVGRLLNAKTASSQLEGGIVWGVSLALFEDSVLDERFGRFVNGNLAEYHVPVNADIGAIDVSFIGEPDPQIGPLGARGIGEIGITGASGAVANAVYHATGKRIRDLPITLDKLL